eukprot:1144545-Pelagomonas_calceolata.AAC.5
MKEQVTEIIAFFCPEIHGVSNRQADLEAPADRSSEGCSAPGHRDRSARSPLCLAQDPSGWHGAHSDHQLPPAHGTKIMRELSMGVAGPGGCH